MSRVTLYSLIPERIAYPSAAFGTDDHRSMLGLYAFGAASASTVVPSRALLALSDRVVTGLGVRDSVVTGLSVRDTVS